MPTCGQAAKGVAFVPSGCGAGPLPATPAGLVGAGFATDVGACADGLEAPLEQAAASSAVAAMHV